MRSLRPGDLLGEMAAIDAQPRSGTVTTLEPVDALLVPGSAFAAFLEHHPRVALVILRMIAGRLRYADAQQAEVRNHRRRRPCLPPAGRAVRALRDSRHAGIEIELPLSQEELAAWTGASREAVSKALQLLRSLQIVKTGRRHVTVLDLAALRQRAQ